MNRLIVLSPFDCVFYSNTRSHHVGDQLRCRYDEVMLIFKHNNTGTEVSRWRKLASFLRLRIKLNREANLVYVAVTPLFARRDGLSLALMGVADMYERASTPYRDFKLRLLSLGGLVLDMFLIPSYLLAYVRQGAPKASAIIAQGPAEFLVARTLQILRRTSLVVYDDLDYVPGSYTVSEFKNRIIRALENYCIRKADVVVSVGELLAQLRLQEVGRNVRTVPNGADIALFARARNRQPHVPTLIYMGTVVAWSGVDITITALTMIRKKIPDVRLLVAGHSTPEYRAFLEALCKQKGVRAHVHFLGKKTPTELVPLLAQADIGMATFKPVKLRKYAFSLKIIEYMAAGLPVITTVDTQSELVIVKHGAGLAVGYEPQAIAEAAIQLLTDPERYWAMAVRGMRASADYSWDTLMLDGLYPALSQASAAATAPAP